MELEIAFDPLLLDATFDNYELVKDQFIELVNKCYTEKYNHKVQPIVKEKIYYWKELGQRNADLQRKTTDRVYYISKYYETSKKYGKSGRYEGNFFTSFSNKYYEEKKINKNYPSDEQYELCRTAYINWIKTQENIEIFDKDEIQKLRKEKDELEYDRKYPRDINGKRQYEFYLGENPSKKEITENNKLLKKGEGKQETPKPSEREIELIKLISKSNKSDYQLKALLNYTNRKTKDHKKLLTCRTYNRNLARYTIDIGNQLNFFRLKEIDKEKGRATNLGEKATHYSNCIGWEFRGTHSVKELEDFARANGYKPKPKDKYEDYKVWLIENLYKKN